MLIQIQPIEPRMYAEFQELVSEGLARYSANCRTYDDVLPLDRRSIQGLTSNPPVTVIR